MQKSNTATQVALKAQLAGFLLLEGRSNCGASESAARASSPLPTPEGYVYFAASGGLSPSMKQLYDVQTMGKSACGEAWQPRHFLTVAYIMTMSILRHIMIPTEPEDEEENHVVEVGPLVVRAVAEINALLRAVQPADHIIMCALLFAKRLVAHGMLPAHLVDESAYVAVVRLFEVCMFLSIRALADECGWIKEHEPHHAAYRGLKRAALRTMDYDITVHLADWSEFLRDEAYIWRRVADSDIANIRALDVAGTAVPEAITEWLQDMVDRADEVAHVEPALRSSPRETDFDAYVDFALALLADW
ncbi:hypothetical protein HDZ31DRAFT_63729 [Schizophyllum fasciatum]